MELLAIVFLSIVIFYGLHGAVTLSKIYGEEGLFALIEKQGSAKDVMFVAARFLLGPNAVSISWLMEPVWRGHFFIRNHAWPHRISFLLSLIACTTAEGTEERTRIVSTVAYRLYIMRPALRDNTLLELLSSQRHKKITEEIRECFAQCTQTINPEVVL